ncbi:MAG: hypothetical protein ACUVV5_06725 [Candidatus Aminicenantales bacterium]
MKTKVLLSGAIFLLAIGFISCQKDVNPFSPQMEGEDESAPASSANTLASQSKTEGLSSPKTGKNERSPEVNWGEKGDPQAEQGGVDSLESGQGLIKGNDFVAAGGVANLVNHNSRKRELGRRHDGEEDHDLSVLIQPSVWNTNWEHSEGLVTVRVFGPGFEAIDPKTLRMVGPGGDKTGEPILAETGPFFVMAKFSQSEAISILPDPKPGQTYDIQVIWGNGAGQKASEGLSFPIRIVGRERQIGELTLEIRPDQWNLAWANSTQDDGAEVVVARISGQGFSSIVPNSVKMDYPDGHLGPIFPIPNSSEVGGFFLVVKFTQKSAISLIPTPKKGDSYEIHVSGQLTDGKTFDLTDRIQILGKKSAE